MYGSWLGLRAVVVFDLDYNCAAEYVVPKAEKCMCEGMIVIKSLNIECDEKAKHILDELMLTTDYCADKHKDAVWRKWLSLRTICEEQKFPYSWNQAAYHYSKNQLYLKGDMDRVQNGTFKPTYDWIPDFNKDILHYRENEY